MIYTELSDWIAESESWQAYIDYRVADTNQNGKQFIQRPSDFYISLITHLQEVLENNYAEETDENKTDLLAVAKGLEIYSLERKRDAFLGVNYQRNMLYVASLYYLADFSATAVLLLRQFKEEDFPSSLEKFLYYFLSRTFNRGNVPSNLYFKRIFAFLRDGNTNEILELSQSLENILQSEDTDSRHFILAYFSKCIVKKFSNNNIWLDLIPFASLEEWKPYIRFNINKIPPIWSFFPSQQSAISKGLLTFERAFSLQTPTSSGKTAISELVIYNEFRKDQGVKILYLAPFRALASELKNNLGRNLTSRLGIRIKTIYGGNVVTELDRMSIEEATVLISTPEKFMAIETSEPGILDQFHVVICDEGHLIDSSSRGISYELLLSRLKRSVTNPKRFLFLSAIIPNIDKINMWLGGNSDDIAISNYRPTEIELAFLSQLDQREFNLEVNPNEAVPQKYTVEKFLSQADFQLNDRVFTPTTYKAKAAAAALKALNSGAVAIFAPTKGIREGTKGIATEVLTQIQFNLPKPLAYSDPEAVEELTEYFEKIFGADYLLTLSIRAGFLYHHGDLPQFIRELVENYVRNEKIKLLVCTTTLSEGVNLPIKTMVISSAKRFNGSVAEPLSKRDLKNLIGRAGRAGKETKGTIIIVNPNDFNRFLDVIENRGLEEANGFLAHVVKVIDDYIRRNGTRLTNELLDQLEQSDIIDNAIIHLLAEDINIDQLENDIKTLMENTFTFYQSTPVRKRRLEEIFSLRSEKIRTAVEANKINSIKTTGIPLRIYDQFVAEIPTEDELLATTTDSLNQEWLNFLFDTIYKLEDVRTTVPPIFTREKLVSVVVQWMSGEWYPVIAGILETDIDASLEAMKFLEYEFQNTVNSIIKYIEQQRSANDQETSVTVLEWANYLNYGVKTRLQIDLIEIGLSDRILVWAVSNYIEQNEIVINDKNDLKNLIIQNGTEIINTLDDELPELSKKALSLFVLRSRIN